MNDSHFSRTHDQHDFKYIVTLLRRGKSVRLTRDIPGGKFVVTIEPCLPDLPSDFDIRGEVHLDPRSPVATCVKRFPVLADVMTAHINAVVAALLERLEAASAECPLDS